MSIRTKNLRDYSGTFALLFAGEKSTVVLTKLGRPAETTPELELPVWVRSAEGFPQSGSFRPCQVSMISN